MADTGLTEGKFDLLETAIETYNLLLGTPRSERTAATGNLQQMSDEIERLFEKGLDKLPLQFTSITFHQDYLLTRDPIAIAHRKAEATPAPTPVPPAP